MKLSYQDRSNQLQSVIKTRQDNDVTDRKDMVYVENKTKLLCLIEPGVVCDENQIRQRREIELSWLIELGACDENQIGQQCDQSYMCTLHKNDTKLSSLIR